MKKKKMLVLNGILLLVTAIFSACGTQAIEAPSIELPSETHAFEDPDTSEILIGNVLRGGLLYDNWFEVLGVDAPEGDQPLWATQSTNERSGEVTWRCKECHGWDYLGHEGAYGSGSHMTGFIGVNQVAGQDAIEILAALQGATNPDHDFSIYMNNQDLIDLALFLNGYQFDSKSIIDENKIAFGGSVESGETIFEENCTDCHGPQGTSINFSDEGGSEYVGTLALDNPWEFIHKARFGQPGVDRMPSLIDVGYDDSDYTHLLAYAQSLPTFVLVDEGGRLYDNWFVTLGTEAPAGNQPLWMTQDTNERFGGDTWRCKECHGWDYLGHEGQYGSGSHFTGFPGILSARDKSEEELTIQLTSGNHDFSSHFNDDQIKALISFIRQMQDMTPFINEDKTINGDTEHGNVLYNTSCSMCHGTNGKLIDFDDGEGTEYVGTLANENPWEVFHKISYGQPGTSMPPAVSLGWSWQDIVDVLAYLQTLPNE
ncbi:MAG TPA: c-type cytochrome [Anaerolineales bacterium]